MDRFRRAVILPLVSMRKEYLPFLLVYFAFGAAAITSVASQFWSIQQLGLTPATLAAYSMWMGLPWAIKMLPGQLVDALPIFGSNRRSYIFLGAALLSGSYALLAGASGGHAWALALGAPATLYLVAGVLGSTGLMFQDVVADAMTKDVLDPSLDELEQREQANVVQALGRLAVGFGGIIAAGLSGPLAKAFSFETVFWIGMVAPFCSVLGAILVKPKSPERAEADWMIIGGGFAFGLLSLAYKVLGIPFAAEASFLTGCAIIVPLVLRLFRDLPRDEVAVLIATGIMVFIFRAVPLAGPGATAWQMEVLGFDKAFMGLLAFVTEGIGFLGIWFAVDWLRRATIARVYTIITIVGFILALPTVAMYYGLHHWTEAHFGFGARSIAIVDIALASPFGHLSLIPILALIARYAASACAATWFAIVASFVNLALAAKQIGTVYLNTIWVVVPGTFDPAGALTKAGDYAELGELMVVANMIGLVIPLLAIWFLRKKLI